MWSRPQPDSEIGGATRGPAEAASAPVEHTVIGVDIGGTNIEIALADGRGDILRRARLATDADAGPDQALSRIGAVVRDLSLIALDAGTPVVAHAAVCAGVVQSERVLLAPNLPGWEDLALGRRLAADLGVREVAVLNDVRAGALAELRFGALYGVDPGIYLSLGTGIGAALTVAGQVLAGADQAAGEIGYLIPVPGLSPVGGPPDLTLEEMVGGRALGRAASQALGEPLTAAALFARRDPAARLLVEQALDALAGTMANLAVFVNPAKIVVGGGMMASADVILPALAERLKQVVPFPPEIEVARFTEDASLHGAVALALDGLALDGLALDSALDRALATVGPSAAERSATCS